jgi:endonuclease/exonuclease/phosphatase family metal-dependent hydrolase
MSANVLFGRADPRQIADLARGVDVVAIQENTPSFDEALRAVLAVDFPHQLGTSREDASGTMLWSRTPMEHVGSGDTRFTSMVATTTVRGVQWTVANVHPSPPQHGSRQWVGDARKVLDLLGSHLDERLVVVGDFNAVEEHLTMRRLVSAGLRNAMRGRRAPGAAAWQPSWPADRTWVPPLIRIDHALHADSVQAWRPRYTRVRGSDHKALIAVFGAR